MSMGSQPQPAQPTGPSGEQLGIAQMGQFAQQPNSLAGILSNLNALTGSTMSPYGPASTNVVVMPQAQQTTAAAHGGSGITLGSGSGAGSSGTGLSSSQLTKVGTALGKGAQSLYNLLSGSSPIDSALGLTAAMKLAPPSMSPVGTGAVSSAANQAGASAAQELNNALSGSSPIDSALGLTSATQLAPLTASQMLPVGTGAISSAANAAASSAASELASALGSNSGSLASAMGLSAGSLAPLTASQMLPVGTGAISAAANQAGASAAQELANAGYGSPASGLAGDASTALGVLGTGYSLYNEAKNYQSGATGSDALSGAETGAGIGTMILPGIGTAIGGLLGGAGGALASAFGGGRVDPETTLWNSTAQSAAKNPSALSGMNPSQLYQNLAGMMDAKNNSIGHSTPLELAFGRMGEGSLTSQMADQVNSALAANPSLKGDSASQLYSSVVEPWLQSKNAYVAPTDVVSSNGALAGNTVNNLLTNLLGDWMNGSLTGASKVGIAGQTIAGLPTFGGSTPAASTLAGTTNTTSALLNALRGGGGGSMKTIARGMT